MASSYLFSFLLLLSHNLLNCASAAVHGHNIDLNNVERESDGAYKPRDADHYTKQGHNMEFDHEAIIGSVKEAEEYDRLSPDESKRRLSLLLPKMDLNADKYIDSEELKQWILNSFAKLSREEAEESFLETDFNQDGVVTWSEYLKEAFGADSEDSLGEDETGDTGMLVFEEKAMFKAADKNGDGVLDLDEFEVLSTPEEHVEMHPYLVNQTLREKDLDKDGALTFNEYVGDRGKGQDHEWLLVEREKFELELDQNRDGILDPAEIAAWIIPSNLEIATEEMEHLFESADDNRDGLLSYDEILEHHDVFVGSEATDSILGDHFEDEL